MLYAVRMCHVLGHLCSKQAAIVSERNEQLDTGLVQPRRAHQSDCGNVVRHGYYQTSSARTRRILGRAVRAVQFIRHMVRPPRRGLRQSLFIIRFKLLRQ